MYPTYKVDEYIKYTFQRKLDMIAFKEFVKKCRQIYKEEKNPFYKEYVEGDAIIDTVIKKYKEVVQAKKNEVLNLFQGFDYDDHDYISINEWVLMYRWVEPDLFEIQ